MKWVRGKKGKREAVSETTGARYVYVDGVLRAAQTPGAWDNLGHHDDIEKAGKVAADHDAFIARRLETETQARAEGLALAQERASLRNLFRDVFLEEPVGRAYQEYCRCRGGGISSEELIAQLIAQLKSLPPTDSSLLGRCFEDFYAAGMRIRPGGTAPRRNPG